MQVDISIWWNAMFFLVWMTITVLLSDSTYYFWQVLSFLLFIIHTDLPGRSPTAWKGEGVLAGRLVAHIPQPTEK